MYLSFDPKDQKDEGLTSDFNKDNRAKSFFCVFVNKMPRIFSEVFLLTKTQKKLLGVIFDEITG